MAKTPEPFLSVQALLISGEPSKMCVANGLKGFDDVCLIHELCHDC